MTGPSTKVPRFEFVFTPTNKQLSEDKDYFGERLFFGFLSLQAQVIFMLFIPLSARFGFWNKTLPADAYSS